MASETFAFSGLPNYIEWYQCYDDPGRSVWIDGMEIRKSLSWDEEQRKRWHFFYRPIAYAVGRPQWHRIHERERNIARARESLVSLRQTTIAFSGLGGLGFALALAYSWGSLMTVLPLFVLLGALLRLAIRRSAIQQEILECEEAIKSLLGEIEELRKQIPSPPSNEDLKKSLQDDLVAMERWALAKMINEEVSDITLRSRLRHQPLCPPCHSLLIQSWGLLQPPLIRTPFGEEKTGLHRVTETVGSGLVTWRGGLDGAPIYRVLYVQYIFLLERNINVCGFFYDLVTRERFGTRRETFQYRHITNYSIREMELEEQDWMQGLGLPDAFRKLLFGEEVNAFSLAVSSGSHFRCVLADETVIRSMNEWLRTDGKYRELEESQLEYSAVLRRFHGDEQKADEWFEQEKRRRREALKTIEEERRLVEERDTHLAEKALAEIRRCVEEFDAAAKEPVGASPAAA